MFQKLEMILNRIDLNRSPWFCFGLTDINDFGLGSLPCKVPRSASFTISLRLEDTKPMILPYAVEHMADQPYRRFV